MALVYIVGASDLAERLTASLASRPDIRVVVERDPAASFAQASAVVLGPDIPSERALARAAALADERPKLPVLVVTRSVSVSLLKIALRAGVRDVLSEKDSVTEVAAAILDACDTTGGPGSHRAAEGKVVTVFGTKGGVGKSVISTNLAAALAREGNKVVLVDLDLQFGDAAIMLQLPPDRTIRDVVRSFDKLDTEMLDGFLAPHPSGMKVLLAPVSPEDAEWIDASHVERILELLRTMADFVVVDTPSSLNDVVLTALERSDDVYAVATLDVPSIKNIRVSLQKLQQLGLAEGRVGLVLNRADSKVGLEAGDVRKSTGCDVVARVPSDRLVPRSVNRGVPIVLDEPKSAVARSLVDLAEMVGKSSRLVKFDVA